MIQSGLSEMVLDDEWSPARDPQDLAQQTLALIGFDMVQDIAQQRAIERAGLERKNLPVEGAKRYTDRRQDPVRDVDSGYGFPWEHGGDRLGNEPTAGADIQYPAIPGWKQGREVLEQLDLVSWFAKPV